MKKAVLIFISALLICVKAFSADKDIKINYDFENGHFVGYRISGDTIYAGPVSSHADSWFNFKISGVRHRNIVIVFEWINRSKIYEGNYNGAINNTAMVSYDGKGYELLKNTKFALKDPANNTGNYTETITHTFRENVAIVTYCAPWSNTKMAELALKLKSDKRVEVSSIGNSAIRNLPLTYFKITDKNVSETEKKKLFLIAREDAYEAGGSWTIDGLMRFILSNDPVAKEMLKKMVFVIFPIFSVDGVAMGTTNYPLDPQNSKFVYVTSDWDQEPTPYPEIKLMKDFWERMKRDRFEPDIAFKFHSTCYWQGHFRPEDCSAENKPREMELLGVLRNHLPWRQRDPDLSHSNGYMNCNFVKVFPNAITYSSHNDFIFTSQLSKLIKKPVYRRHEDLLQDGELIARSYASFYGIPTKEVAPYLMAGDVNRNCGPKGTELTYSVYYYDLNQMPPAKIEILINGRPYKMVAESTPDFKLPVKYTFTTTLSQKTNNYCFRASNGKKERRVPEENYLLPGPFIIK